MGIRRAAERDANFAYLLAGLLLALAAGPVLDEFELVRGGLVPSVIFTGTMVIGIWSLLEQKIWFWFGVALIALMFSGILARIFGSDPMLNLISLFATFLFCCLSTAFATRHLFSGQGITGNRLIGAVCVYLLIGIAISTLNMVIFQFVPGSFRGLENIHTSATGTNMIYYTFVTMSTLGYGDISPARPLARGLAYMAAVAGQFYIAILVSLLVSMYLSGRSNDS